MPTSTATTAASACRPWTPAMSAWWRSRCGPTASSTTAAIATSAWVRRGPPAVRGAALRAAGGKAPRLTLLCPSLGPCPSGMKLANLSKILKCAGNDDAITMKSEDNGDTITFMFESPSEPGCAARSSAAGCCPKRLAVGCSGGWCLLLALLPARCAAERWWLVALATYTGAGTSSAVVAFARSFPTACSAPHAVSLPCPALLQTRSGCPSLTSSSWTSTGQDREAGARAGSGQGGKEE